MFEWFILFIVLITIYIIMKKSSATTEKSVPKSEHSVVEESTKPAPKTASSNRVVKEQESISETKAKSTPPAKTETSKKTNPSHSSSSKAEAEKATEPKPVKDKPKAESPKPIKDKPKAESPKPTTPKPVEKAAPQPVADEPEITIAARVGLTAGSIWQYLDKNGPTTVAKLLKDLPEEEKIVQRSIGWLAQEGKISIETINRAETISLI